MKLQRNDEIFAMHSLFPRFVGVAKVRAGKGKGTAGEAGEGRGERRGKRKERGSTAEGIYYFNSLFRYCS